jgi:two-component system phosphate regulon response regulator OmpR
MQNNDENSPEIMTSAPDFFENKTHILVVDDDERIRSLIRRYLTQQGFVVSAASNAKEAKDSLTRCTFDALVLDVMMPGQDGISLTAELKAQSNTPIILLTALGEVEDRIRGLENGADDYLPKPFEPQELALRLQAITRRAAIARSNNQYRDYRIGPWVYAPKDSTLRQNQESGDTTVTLTSGENALLSALAKNYGQVLDRDQLAALCNIDSGERTIDVQITRLRRKIEENPKDPKSIQTIRGQGYVLNAAPLV